MKKKYDVVVIGSGMTGLAVAYELVKKGRKVLVVEKGKRVGGLLHSIKVGDTFLEVFYHHLFLDDKYVIKVMKELDIENRLEWKYATTAFLFKDGIFELSKPQDILGFKPFNLLEKWRFVKLMLKIKFANNLEELDKIQAKEWIIRNGGKSLYYKMFHPLLKSKFGEKLEEISAAWFVERINLRGNRTLRGEKLGYIKGGFQVLLEKMVDEIKKLGVELLLNSKVSGIFVENGRVVGVEVNGERIGVGCVVSTIPPSFLLKFGIFDEEYADKIRKTEYQGIFIVLLGLKKKLSKFYWTNIAQDSYIGAAIEHTNFQPVKLYGSHIVYLAKYPDMKSELWEMKEEDVFEKYWKDLKKMFPHITKKDVFWWRIFKAKNAGVVYKIGFKKHILHYTPPVQGLIIGGLFNMYPERSVNLSLKIGEICAILADEIIRYGKEDYKDRFGKRLQDHEDGRFLLLVEKEENIPPHIKKQFLHKKWIVKKNGGIDLSKLGKLYLESLRSIYE